MFTAILRHTRTVANFSVATSWFLVDVNQTVAITILGSVLAEKWFVLLQEVE